MTFTAKKIIVEILIGIAMIVVSFGFVVPALISRPDTAEVFLGVIFGIATLVLIIQRTFYWINVCSDEYDKYYGSETMIDLDYVENIDDIKTEEKMKTKTNTSFCLMGLVWLILLIIFSFFWLTTSGCGNFAFRRCKVPAGYKGIRVYLYGTRKGVQSEVVGVGKYWLTINEEMYLFPTFTQNYVFTRSKTEGSPVDEHISFQTSGGTVIGADVGVSYNIREDGVSLVFEKFRKGIDEITHEYLRNYIRDAFVKSASVRTVEEVYGKGKSALLAEIEENIRSQVSDIGINLERVYFVGDLRLPPVVVEAINAKIEAVQRAQQRANEVAESEAEARKKIEAAKGERDSTIAKAEGKAKARLLEADAEAKANLMIAKSITKEYIDYIRVNQWDGVMPKIVGGTDIWSMIEMPLNDEPK